MALVFEISSQITDRMSANDRKSISLKVFDFKGPSKKLQGEFLPELSVRKSMIHTV